jgi:hypothetical protein
VILGHTEFLLKRDESKESSRLRITEIRSAAERGALLPSSFWRSRVARVLRRDVASETHSQIERQQDYTHADSKATYPGMAGWLSLIPPSRFRTSLHSPD